MYSRYCDESTPLNKAVKHNYCPWHGPAPGRGFVVTRVPEGWLMWCHACLRSHFVRIKGALKGQSKSKILTKLQSLIKGHSSTEKPVEANCERVSLPSDCTSHLPKAGVLWLAKSGISKEIAKEFGICYSPKMQRLILPVYSYEKKELVFWQARNLYEITPARPKYISTQMKRGDIWFELRPKKGLDKYGVCVIVEDILSAIKVYLACDRQVHTIALLGSHVLGKLESYLASRSSSVYKTILIWLDPDKQKVAASSAKDLRAKVAGSCTVRSILGTRKDPKEYTTDYIRRKIICPQK